MLVMKMTLDEIIEMAYFEKEGPGRGIDLRCTFLRLDAELSLLC